MIQVHKLNGKDIIINCDLIETIESTPDTTITLTTGKLLIAQESVEEIRARVIEYKRKLYLN